MRRMSESTVSNRTDLQRLARRATLAAGFLPEFGAAALAEPAAIGASAGTRLPSACDPRIFRPPVEGRVVGGFQGLDLGDRVGLELVGTNAENGFIDFARAA
jgi:RNase II-type exonuclease